MEPAIPVHAVGMPTFCFHVSHSHAAESTALQEVCESSEDAWRSAAALCADLARDVVGKLTPDSEWRVDVSDEIGTALFSLRLVAETLA
jgi:hypothetical protein